MTDNLDNLKKCEDAGAGAVVLKSLFEEEIVAEMGATRQAMERPGFTFPDTADMDDFIDDETGMTRYLKLISDAREALDVPVIASVNAVSPRTWPSFTEMLERAGAQAVELNIFLMPSDVHTDDVFAFERTYFDIVRAVLDQVQIPVSVKLSYHFTLLARTLKQLSETGIDGLVLFNRFFNPDFDLDTLEIVPTNVLSTPDLLHLSLRWIAIMRGQITGSLAASTGVHDGNGVIKQILAGADAVQVASVLYREGFDAISQMNTRLQRWMDEHDYATLPDFRGMLSHGRVSDPAIFDRVQFVRNYRAFGRRM